MGKKRWLSFHDHGFTLIEVILTIGILAILSVVGMLQFQNYHMKSYNTAALTDLQHVKTQLTAYYADNQYYP